MTAMANPWKGILPLAFVLAVVAVGCGWLVSEWWFR